MRTRELEGLYLNNSAEISQLDADKIETSAIVNTLTETSEGKVLDARQGKALSDIIATNTTNIGDLAYTENNYITDSEPLTESVDKLDMAVNDIAAQIQAFAGTLVNTDWTGSAAPYTKAVTVTGILDAGKPPTVDVTLSETWDTALVEDEEWAKIKRIAYTNNTLTFYATAVPSVALNFTGVQPK